METQTGKHGGLLAILTGIGYLIYGLGRVIDSQPSYTAGEDEFFASLVNESTFLYTLGNWALFFASVFAIGMVMALRELVMNEENKFMVNYVSNLGIIAHTLMAFAFADLLVRTISIAEAYNALDANGQAVVNALGQPIYDVAGLFRAGVTGIWLIYAMYQARKGGHLPSTLTLVGMIAGFAYLLFPINRLLLGGSLSLVINLSAAILGPVTFIWIGLQLRSK